MINTINLFIDLVVVGAALYCVFTDIRLQKIKNYITFPLMLFGLIINLCKNGAKGILFSINGMIICAAIALLFVALKGFGMGDMKLMMGIGAVKGGIFALDVFVFSFFAAILISIITHPQRFIKALKNLFNSFLYFIFSRRIYNIDKHESAYVFPYAICIFIGLVMTYLSGGDFIWSLLHG